MAYSLEDAIQGWIRYNQARVDPLHSRVFNRDKQIWIDTLGSAPADLRMLDLEIGRKKRRLENEKQAANKWMIHAEVEALEWVRGRIICQDFELWAKAA